MEAVIMQHSSRQTSWTTSGLALVRRGGLSAAFAVLTLVIPATARAQYSAPADTSNTTAIGEKYHIEFSGTLWNPTLFGVISSEQFGSNNASDIDFVSDLGYKQTRFKDMRIVARPSKRSKFRLQYTPVVYTANSVLKRPVVFNNQTFNVNLPVLSTFGWKVWRMGFEYDVLYKSRGFVGVLLEARYTEMSADLRSPVLHEFSVAKAPLPALGIVGRGYILPEVAINFELSGFKVPDVDKRYQANYFDWDLSGTVNVTNYVGLQAGWRKMTTFLSVKNDKGDLKFQGLWFGAAVRY